MSQIKTIAENSKLCQLLDELSREILFFYDESTAKRTFLLIRILLNNSDNAGRNLGEILLERFCSECDEQQFVIFLKVFGHQNPTLKRGISAFQTQMEKFFTTPDNQRASEAFVKFAESRVDGLELVDIWLENSFVRAVCLTNFELSSQVYNLFFNSYSAFCETVMAKVEGSGQEVSDSVAENKIQRDKEERARGFLGSSISILKLVIEKIWGVMDIWEREGPRKFSTLILRKYLRAHNMLEIEGHWRERLSLDFEKWRTFGWDELGTELEAPHQSGQNTLSTAENRELSFPIFDLDKVLSDDKILEHGCLLLGFLKKLTMFLISENKYENTYNFLVKIEKKMIADHDPFYLALSGPLLRSLVSVLEHGAKGALQGRSPFTGPDMDTLQPLLVTAQNLGHLEPDFVSYAFQLLEMSSQPFLMLTNPNTHQVVAWVLEMRLKRVLLMADSIDGLKQLAEVTRIAQLLLRKTDNEAFLQMIYLVFLRVLAEGGEEQFGLPVHRKKGNMKSTLGLYLGAYDKKMIFNPNKFIEASGFSGLYFG